MSAPGAVGVASRDADPKLDNLDIVREVLRLDRWCDRRGGSNTASISMWRGGDGADSVAEELSRQAVMARGNSELTFCRSMHRSTSRSIYTGPCQTGRRLLRTIPLPAQE